MYGGGCLVRLSQGIYKKSHEKWAQKNPHRYKTGRVFLNPAKQGNSV